MRLFLAINLPQKTKEEIEASLNDLKKEYPNFIWVPKENFHITLFFYGETNSFKKIKEKVSDLIYDIPPFYLYSRNIDLFAGKKIVIYLNFEREKILETLFTKINHYFSSLYKTNYTNYSQRKKYIPHLTLARYKIPSKQQYFLLKKKLKKNNINISFVVEKVVLFQSIIGGHRPIYRQLASFPLLKK